MPVRINVGLSKKVGQQNFGSLGATCNVEFELDGGYDNGSTDRFQDAVRRAYSACREAVEAELSESEAKQASQVGGQHQSPTTNRVATQTNGSQPRKATSSQVRAIHAIANRNKKLSFEFVVITKTKSPTVERFAVQSSWRRIERTKLIANITLDAIATGVFYPNKNPMTCSTCPYQKACAAWRG